ncbi:hypothetical protein J6590_107674, partial [Homalodisca vitripennis]
SSSEAAMANTDERKFLLEVIEVYSSLPALWDNKCKDYSNRIKKNEQYDKLLQKYNKRYSEADRKALPTLWYFDEIKLLTDLEEPTDSANTMLDDEEIEGNELNITPCYWLNKVPPGPVKHYAEQYPGVPVSFRCDNCSRISIFKSIIWNSGVSHNSSHFSQIAAQT